MTMMKIEVYPDTSVPSGGHAIIRLKGVALLPPGATFTIAPIDDAMATADGWPHGDLRPLETRQTAEGIEMRVGPDVVDAPRLEPGTPVTISVPDGHLSAELVWPDLPVSSSRAAVSVVMTPSQMAAELAASERARMDAARAAEAAAALAIAERTARQGRIDAEQARLVAQAQDAARLAAIEQARMASASRAVDAALISERGPLTGAAVPNASVNSGASLPSATLPSAVASAEMIDRTLKATSPQNTVRTEGRGADRSLSSLAKPASTAGGAGAGATDRPEIAVMERDAAMPSIMLKRASDGPSSPIAVQRTELRPETIDGRISRPTGTRLMPFLAGAGAAGIAAAAVFAVFMARNGSTLVAGSEATRGSVVKSGIADSFSAGLQSPRGETAADVDLPTALRLADYNLHGVDRPVDRAEGEFWLKKAMSLTASHSQLRWAMTQLGTLSAEPVSGAPDYERARMLWEISAANGDPVAMCFLGTLQEFGLGIAPDRAKALESFKRSKEFGGCPNTDEAIARLSK